MYVAKTPPPPRRSPRRDARAARDAPIARATRPPPPPPPPFLAPSSHPAPPARHARFPTRARRSPAATARSSLDVRPFRARLLHGGGRAPRYPAPHVHGALLAACADATGGAGEVTRAAFDDLLEARAADLLRLSAGQRRTSCSRSRARARRRRGSRSGSGPHRPRHPRVPRRVVPRGAGRHPDGEPNPPIPWIGFVYFERCASSSSRSSTSAGSSRATSSRGTRT